MRQRMISASGLASCLVLAGCSAPHTARAPDAAELSRRPDSLVEAIVYTTLRPPNFDLFLFEDTGDGLLQFGEIIGFSGVTCSPCGPNGFFDTVTTVPNIAGISTLSGNVTLFQPGWHFGRANGDDLYLFASHWDYAISGAVEVPEPATLSLLGMGLLGLAIATRRRRRFV